MARKLRQLRIDRVDLVDKGANQDAHILLFKRAAADMSDLEEEIEKQEEVSTDTRSAGPEQQTATTPAQTEVLPLTETEKASGESLPAMEGIPMTVGSIMAQQDMHQEFCRLREAFFQSLDHIFTFAPPAAQAPLLLQSAEEFATHARKVLSPYAKRADPGPLLAEVLEVVKAGRKISAARMQRLRTILSELEAIMMEGIAGDEKTEKQEGDPPMSKLLTDQVEALTKRAETAEADAEELSKQLAAVQEQIAAFTKRAEAAEALAAKLQTQLDENDPEAIWKGVSPALRARIEKAEAERDAERQQRLKSEFIAKANTFKALPINPDDDWEMFRDMTVLPAKTQRRIESLFKAGEEAFLNGKFFHEVGKAGTGEPQGDALDQLNTLAKERVNKGLSKTFAQAMDAVMQEQPALYRQYKLERRG